MVRNGSLPVTQRRLPLSKVNFGKIDARNEVLTRDEKVLQHFKESFLEPSGVSIDEFRSGDRFFIYGSKGAGKTAFLRYIQLMMQNQGCFTRFVTFASDISEEERERLGNLSNISMVEQDADPENNAVNVWLLFIFREIAQQISENKKVFSSNKELKYFVDLVNKFYEGEKKGFLSWLFETAKRGKYKVSAKYLEANLTGHAGDAEREVPLDIIVRQCLNLLKHLSWEGPSSIYFFFDELNLSFGSRVQHKRDAILIRDLILAIDKMNVFFIENEKPVYLIAAARSEVLNAVTVPTHEINKVLSDRGRELRWFSKTAAEQPPIAELLQKKIQASEKVAKYRVSSNVFDQYFRKSTFGMTPQSLIVDLTWCNPRDLILLFGTAAAGDENALFDEPVLARALEKYSGDAWNEKIEELGVEYAPVELQSLRKLFISFERYFRIADFDKRKKDKSEIDQNVANFVKKRSSAKILEDLYRVGVVGQSTRNPKEGGARPKQFEEHWAYRGDNSFDPGAWMVVHRALWPNLRLGEIWTNR